MKSLFTLCIVAVTLMAQAVLAGPAVKLETTSGDIVIELDDKAAPVTVENFLGYVNSGHYDGTIFHRVIDGFMIQGGGFDIKFGQRETRDPIINEGGNGLRNDLGTIAMARTNAPDSATAQFFINVQDNDFLNYQSENNPGYAVFGNVTQGLDVVLDISKRPTGPGGPFRQDVPAAPVIILSATVVSD